jgi:hypothetical protein
MKRATTYIDLFGIWFLVTAFGLAGTAYGAPNDSAVNINSGAMVPIGWLFVWLLGGGAILIFVGRKLNQVDSLISKVDSLAQKVDALTTLMATRPCVLNGTCHTAGHKKDTQTT